MNTAFKRQHRGNYLPAAFSDNPLTITSLAHWSFDPKRRTRRPRQNALWAEAMRVLLANSKKNIGQ